MREKQIFEGAEIDGFTLGPPLKTGGMASIWRATKPGVDFPLVLKFPFFAPGDDPAAIIAYEIEEMILKRLSGPHVPRYAGSGDLGRLPYLAMEFVEGEGLETFAARAPLNWREVADIGAALCRALDSLHRQKVVHLDLKTRNVIMAKRGAVLIDFGLARHLELPDLLGEESGLPIGTSSTIAPEQLFGVRDNPASDIFALGCVLYELATGEPPFGEPATPAGMKRRLYQPPAPPRAKNADLPRWLEAIILRCLEVDPGKRYASAALVAADLAHPEQVLLPKEAPAAGLVARLAAPFRRKQAPDFAAMLRQRPQEAMLVMAAVDLGEGQAALAEAIRDETARVMAYAGRRRLACLTVLRTHLVGEDKTVDAQGRLVYLNRLVALREWARPFGLAEDRVSFHVVEALDVARAALDFIAHNGVDHAIVGARAASALRRHLGSVSARIVAEADCTVTVVRLPAGPAEAPPPP